MSPAFHITLRVLATVGLAAFAADIATRKPKWEMDRSFALLEHRIAALDVPEYEKGSLRLDINLVKEHYSFHREQEREKFLTLGIIGIFVSVLLVAPYPLRRKTPNQ